MTEKLNVLIELERRGALPDKYKPLLEELRRRNVVGRAGDWRTGLSSIGKGVTKGLAHIAGAPVDVATAGINLAGAGVERLTGADIPGIPIERAVGGSQSISEALSGEATLMGKPQPKEAPIELPAMTYSDISDIPSRYRPAARFGEVLGESAPFGAGFLKAAGNLAGTGRIAGQPAFQGSRSVQSKITDPIVAQAQRVGPGKFAAQEAAIATGAGIGAGTAEVISPGNIPARIGGEITGALLSPTSLFINSSSRLAQSIRQTAESFTREGAETAAARRLQELAESFGEDPGVLAEQLRVPGIPSATSGQRTASPALTALERKVIKDDANVSLDLGRQTQQMIDEVNKSFQILAGRGDPESLRLLAEARQEHWNNLMDYHVAQAERKLAEAAEKIGPQSPQARSQANLSARSVLEEALKDARKWEKDLWADVNKDIDTPVDNLAKAYRENTEDLLEGEGLKVQNKAIIASIKKWTKKPKAGEDPPEPPTSGEMLRLRGRILAEMRRIRGDQAPDWDLHRRLDNIQIAIIDDLEGVDEAAKVARTFSHELHNRFSRSAAHQALGRDVRGASRVEPELALEKTLAPKPGPERAVVAGQLSRAAEPFQGMPATTRPATMAEAQEQLVRDLASTAVDPSTGKINQRTLARFREKNRDLIERFPALGRDLESAQTINKQYGNRLKTLAKRDKTIRDESAFRKVVNYEDPRRSIEAAMDGRFPISDLSRIYQLARTDSKALKGATRATLEVFYRKATNANTGMISGEQMKALLDQYKPVMLKYGVLTKGRLRRLEQVADEAAKAEASMKFHGEIAAKVGDVSDIFDLALRWAGANIGGASALGRASGTSLVMAGHFSRTFRKWFEKVPATRIGDVLTEAVMNPEFMADLLAKPVTRPQILARDRRIRSVLGRLGLETAQRQHFHAGVMQIGVPVTEGEQ
jgi:hypothetical protein